MNVLSWAKKNPLMAIGIGAGMAYLANSYSPISGLGMTTSTSTSTSSSHTPDIMRRQNEANWNYQEATANDLFGLGRAGTIGDEMDDMFRKTGWTGKHAYGNPEPIHPMPSGPKVGYRAEEHEQRGPVLDPMYTARTRPKLQPASVRNMGLETTVALHSDVFAGIDTTNTF